MTDEAAPGAQARQVRTALVILSTVVLAVAVFVVFGSAIEAIRVWFEPRWVPIARAAFGLAVAALAIWVLWRLTRLKA